MNSPLNLDARSILFEVTLYLSSSFTNFILKIWRSINFITCLCSPAICCWGLLYWPLSSSFNVLSSDLGSTMMMFYWVPCELWWAQGQVVLIVVTRPRGQTPDGAGYRGRICISLGSSSLLPISSYFSRPGFWKFDIKPMSFDLCRKQWGILQ